MNEDFTNERWLTVAGFEGRYEVSDHGRVRALFEMRSSTGGVNRRWPPPPRIVASNRPPSARYRQVVLCGVDGKLTVRRVHRLVMEAFVGARPSGMECRHLNGDQDDCRRSNLAWGTSVQNTADARRHGRGNAGERNPSAKLTGSNVEEIRTLASGGAPYHTIAKRFGVAQTTVRDIVNRRRWRTLPESESRQEG